MCSEIRFPRRGVHELALATLLVLGASSAHADPFPPGSIANDLPLGDLAFPQAATMIDPVQQCRAVAKVFDQGGFLQVRWVPCPGSLTDPDIEVIAPEVGPEDVIRLDYAVPITNEAGADISVGLAFGGQDAINSISNAYISTDGLNWRLISYQETRVSGYGGAWYDGSEVHQYQVKDALVDLDELGVPAGESVSTLYVKGDERCVRVDAEGSCAVEWTTDLAWVVNLHPAAEPALVIREPHTEGQAVSGTLELRADPVDMVPTRLAMRIRRWKDGINDRICRLTQPTTTNSAYDTYVCQFDSTGYRNVSHRLVFRAFDGQGGKLSSSGRIRMRNR